MSPSDTTMLVVDDEPVVLDTVRDGLIGHGYQVLSATGGNEALQVAQAHQGPIALAVVDVVMPAMSGPEAIQCGSPRRHRGRSVAGQAVQARHARTQGPRDPRLPLPVLASLATAEVIGAVFSPVSVTCSGMARPTLHHLTSLRRHRKVVYSGGQRVTAERALIGGHRS